MVRLLSGKRSSAEPPAVALRNGSISRLFDRSPSNLRLAEWRAKAETRHIEPLSAGHQEMGEAMAVRASMALIGMTILISGCATTGSELTDSATSMRTSISDVRTGTATEIEAINLEANGDTVTGLVKTNQAPDPAAFTPIFDDAFTAKWSSYFNALDLYLAAIEKLVSADRATGVANDVTAAGTATGSIASDTSAGPLAGLFGNLSGDLMQAAADRKALDVMRKADPAFLALTRGLADAVDAGPGSPAGTMRGYVDTHWKAVLGSLKADYDGVKNGSEDQRRANIEAYAKAIADRDAEYRSLAGLRASLLAIGAAHSAAAKGSHSATLYWIGQISEQLQQAKNAAPVGGTQ